MAIFNYARRAPKLRYYILIPLELAVEHDGGV